MASSTGPLIPLTTVFTPPSGCLATATYNEAAIWAPDISGTAKLSPAVLLGATGQAVDLVCYPPDFTPSSIYSPGICPSGWASACEPTFSVSSIPVDGPATTVQCCPSDMTCSGTGWCRGKPKYGPIWSMYTDKWGLEGKMTTAAFSQYSMLGKPIFVAYQTSDQSILSAARAAATSAANSLGGNQTQQTSSGTSLSNGAIAGIAIGSAAGGLILATILTFLALRFCLGYRKHQPVSEKPSRERNYTELGSEGHVNELHSWPRATELDTRPKHSSHNVAELPGQK